MVKRVCTDPEGVRPLDAGLGRELDIEQLIARANAGHDDR
jgi:hypothetical protein